MRKRGSPTNPDQPSRQRIADFFGLELNAVSVQLQQDTFIINIKDNKEAQEQFKTICAFGNGSRPGHYNFKDNIIVWWNGTKVQPV